MENKLSEAAFEGNVSALKILIKEDPLILDRILPSNLTPILHVAVLRGHTEFTRALLSHNPKLATELDAEGRLPLHIAAAKGHVEITRELLRVGNSASNCVARDKDGMTPIHVAIMKGARVEVVRELTQASSESTRLGGETSVYYHLCVRYNNLEALKVLMAENDDVNDLVINEKDENGNTILHLAALHKHLEIIKYLLTRSGMELNAVNKNGLTALDLVENSPKDIKSLEILNFLLKSNAQKANPSSILPNKNSNIQKNNNNNNNNNNIPREKRPKSWKTFFTFNGKTNLEGFRGELLIVSSIIVLIVALPIINMRINPGGPILDDEYLVNTLSLVPALSIMILLVSGIPLKNKFCVWLILQLMYSAIGFLGFNYIGTIISNESRYWNLNGPLILMYIFFGLLIVVSLLNCIRLIVLIVSTVTGCVNRKKLRGRREDISSNV